MPTHYKGAAREVRALDAYLKLRRATGSVQTCLDPGLTRRGLTESQFGVLEALLHLGPLSQCEVARKLLRSDGNLTLVVNNLEKAGLVHRQRDPVDRRRVILHLTASGRKTIAGVFPDHLARIVELLSVLTADEQITLGNLCRKVGLAAQRRAEGQAR